MFFLTVKVSPAVAPEVMLIEPIKNKFWFLKLSLSLLSN